MKDRINRAKKQIIRQTPKLVALTGAAVTGAYLMSRYYDNNNHLVSIHSGLSGVIREDGAGFIFDTPMHGTFVLAPVVKQ
jgi:alkylation response protein AidB-like acyl-CoA dehydrogenase